MMGVKQFIDEKKKRIQEYMTKQKEISDKRRAEQNIINERIAAGKKEEIEKQRILLEKYKVQQKYNAEKKRIAARYAPKPKSKPIRFGGSSSRPSLTGFSGKTKSKTGLYGFSGGSSYSSAFGANKSKKKNGTSYQNWRI